MILAMSVGGLSLACTDDGTSEGSASATGTETGTNSGDGDGDNTETGTNSGDGDGDPATGDGDGDVSGDGDGDVSGDGDGDVSGDGDGDISGDGDGDGDISGDGDGDLNPIEPWLLSVNNATDELVKISTDDASTVVLCQLDVPDGYPSTTFGLDGTLYGSNSTDQTLDIIDPCTCETMTLGPTNFGSIPGITANGIEIELLFGVSVSADVLVTLNAQNGAGQEIGPLGVDFHYSGTTWSSELQGLYAIEDITNRLYELDTGTGTAVEIAPLDVNFSSVGIEWHPETMELYACTNVPQQSMLYRVNTDDGTTELVGMLPYNCNNLAAPWVPVGCVDDVPFE